MFNYTVKTNLLPINKKTLILAVGILFLSIISIYTWLPLVIGWGPSGNYQNVSVRTTVNITQAYPEILNVTCGNGTSISLVAGSTYLLTCRVQIRDYNGGNTISSSNLTFYYFMNQSIDPDDKNVHYTNLSCTMNTTDGYYTNWTCGVNIWYYANNGTWIANATVKDNNNFTRSGSANASIGSLYALNVTPLIDFGQLAVNDYSSSIQANVTNFGNRQINITVYGFGDENETRYAGYAMICDQRNLTLPNERYALASATDYDAMTPLTGAATTIPGFSLYQQTDDAQQVINATYWRLHVNITTNPFGVCNGTVIFAAQAS
jgi:hypothetical protein